MDEDEAVFGGVVGAFGLDSDIEEAHPVIQLVFYADCLATDGGEGLMMRGGVVCAGDTEC